MSYSASDHVLDHAEVICDCGFHFEDYTYTLVPCGVEGCKAKTCAECAKRCSYCNLRVCPEHLLETSDKYLVCPACLAVDVKADDLLEQEARSGKPCRDCIDLRGEIASLRELLTQRRVRLNHNARHRLRKLDSRIQWMGEKVSAGHVAMQTEMETLIWARQIIEAFGERPLGREKTTI